MSDEFSATTEDITVVDGVEVDITVRGNEDKASKVLMDLKDRLGYIGAAYHLETPPAEITDRPSEYEPPMSVAWGRVFDDE